MDLLNIYDLSTPNFKSTSMHFFFDEKLSFKSNTWSKFKNKEIEKDEGSRKQTSEKICYQTIKFWTSSISLTCDPPRRKILGDLA